MRYWFGKIRVSQGTRYKVQDTRYKIQGTRYKVQGTYTRKGRKAATSLFNIPCSLFDILPGFIKGFLLRPVFRDVS
jgi:hypothetical protein